jgi:hypothetical protein
LPGTPSRSRSTSRSRPPRRSTFLGYETTRVDDAEVVAIVRDGVEYDELAAIGDTVVS